MKHLIKAHGFSLPKNSKINYKQNPQIKHIGKSDFGADFQLV